MRFVQLFVSFLVIGIGVAAPANDGALFRDTVAPILERNCVGCHSGNKPKGGLSLVSVKSAMSGGESGASIVPGKPDESSLLDYISGNDPEMPKDAKPLSAEEVESIRQWIAAGAVWPVDRQLADKKQNDTNWWSLKSPVKPAIPEIRNPQFEIRNPIDAFILAKLAEKKLTPSTEADRQTLIRRLYYDLVGLPPAPEEVDAFVADSDPQAYEKLVDRLLASPQYGERWGRHWLDIVHYGDTHGYDKDQPRPDAWPYRDYVIRSFNEDKPYGQFVQEQLAGDRLFPGTRDGIEALGFISAGPWDLIGHAEVPEEKIDGKIARMLDRDDMVSNTMNSFASTTVQCARCHNHKFDPVTQEDYYSLQAVFAALDRAPRAYDLDPAVAAERAKLVSDKATLVALQNELQAAAEKQGGPRLIELDKHIAALAEPKPGEPSKAEAYGYHSLIMSSPDHEKWVQVDLGQSTALSRIVLHACKDDFNNVGEGFGFPVRYKVSISDDENFKSGVTVIGDQTQADVANPRLSPISFPVNGQSARFVRVTATKLGLRANDYIFALAELGVFDVTEHNVAAMKTVSALDSIEAPPRWRKTNLVDRYYPGGNLSGDPDELEKYQQERLSLLESATTAESRERLATTATELAAVEAKIAKLPPQPMVYSGTIHQGTGAFRGTGHTGGKPREIHVLSRGDVRNPLQAVGPGVPPLVEDLPTRFEISDDRPESDRRVALARWITDLHHPLTWRSIVNRVWQYHFGRGIVDSPNDFGRMGSLPSHPELLDWLAVEFRDGGQSLKTLHRLICTSATYRQSSAENSSNATVDSGNMYLWRMNRRRLEAEAIRDAVLQVAGKLVPTMGGPGFQDFIVEHPEHSPHYEYKLFDPENAACHRRSVYRFIVRSQPQPFMTTLDCADPSMSVDKRNESMTALQALALLNNRLMVVMSRHFAERLQKDAPDLPGQIDRGVRLCLSRAPTVEEREQLIEYARKFGLPNACRVMFNLNEFAFVD